MRRGARDPAWEQLRATSYPARLVLSALACEHELKSGLQHAGIRPGMRVLDAACGPGVISRFLLDLDAAEVVGCDAGTEMLEMAESLPRRIQAGQQLSFERVDLTGSLPFPDASFDAVFFGDVWLPASFEGVRRALRPVAPSSRRRPMPSPAPTPGTTPSICACAPPRSTPTIDPRTRDVIRTTPPSRSHERMPRRGRTSVACRMWAHGPTSTWPAC